MAMQQDADADLPRPGFARMYARLSPELDRQGFGTLRAELLADLHGEVVEVGAGNGLNFARYPATVERVTAIEPEPTLREHAQDAARSAPVTVEVFAGVADDLPFADGSVDAVVMSLVLCSVSDPAAALAEAGRILRPGGQLRYLEHERADGRIVRGMQRLVDATIWPRLAGGCHTARRPSVSIEQAGFALDNERRMRFPDTWVTSPTTPHVLGTARWPGAAGR